GEILKAIGLKNLIDNLGKCQRVLMISNELLRKIYVKNREYFCLNRHKSSHWIPAFAGMTNALKIHTQGLKFQ
ncbi:MAG: hypothetical protein COW13_04555, partial [Candidatus Omnitrophica bacterium CG12_big_fil_rev_8_21_14_0_65_50_5]